MQERNVEGEIYPQHRVMDRWHWWIDGTDISTHTWPRCRCPYQDSAQDYTFHVFFKFKRWNEDKEEFKRNIGSQYCSFQTGPMSRFKSSLSCAKYWYGHLLHVGQFEISVSSEEVGEVVVLLFMIPIDLFCDVVHWYGVTSFVKRVLKRKKGKT